MQKKWKKWTKKSLKVTRLMRTKQVNKTLPSSGNTRCLNISVHK